VSALVASRRRLRSSSEREPANPVIAGVHSGNREPPIQAGTSAEIPFSGAALLQDRLAFRAACGGIIKFAPEARSSPDIRGKDVLTGPPKASS
jgi:hypothetical protein